LLTQNELATSASAQFGSDGSTDDIVRDGERNEYSGKSSERKKSNDGQPLVTRGDGEGRADNEAK
jgi:hypothetical protein